MATRKKKGPTGPLQLLLPLCSSCQTPLPHGDIIECAVTETLSVPHLTLQISTASIVQCRACDLAHRVYIATSLEEFRCYTAPFDVTSVEEGRKYHTAEPISDADIVAVDDILKGNKLSKTLKLWARKNQLS